MGNTEVRNKKRRKKGSASLSKAALKAKRRKERRRIVILQRVLTACFALAAIGGGGFAIVWNLPSVKLNRQLDAGIEYTEEAAYNDAIQAYENALKIDSTSVKAYRCMAGAYLGMADESGAKQILFEGWENTQDESLLQYYCTVILNEAVAEINQDEVSFETVSKIVDVLEQNIMNEDALELMDTVYERIMQQPAEETSFDFAAYEQVMERLFSIYAADQSDEMKNIVSRFAMIDREELMIPMEHVEPYLNILEKADALEKKEQRGRLIDCLKKEMEVQSVFSGIFAEFDAGNFEAAKDFIITDTYTQIRDAFIEGTMEYWNGATAIPVSREYVLLNQTEDGWTFSYPDFKSNENTAGVITVWGSPMKDNGVQRSAISYEPAKESDTYYPHTEYVITYMYSNVQKKNSFDYTMNYHFETRTWTEEGMTTIMIGDWGGPYQWEKTY